VHTDDVDLIYETGLGYNLLSTNCSLVAKILDCRSTEKSNVIVNTLPSRYSENINHLST